MPEICRFHGIVIRMYGLDHAPPHMHAVYAEHEALIGIEDIDAAETEVWDETAGDGIEK